MVLDDLAQASLTARRWYRAGAELGEPLAVLAFAFAVLGAAPEAPEARSPGPPRAVGVFKRLSSLKGVLWRQSPAVRRVLKALS